MSDAGLANPNLCLGCEEWPTEGHAAGPEGQLFVEEGGGVTAGPHAPPSEHQTIKAA